VTELLIRIFVPNREKLDDPEVRGKYGTLAGMVGIICNLLLFFSKLLIGVLSRSVSITADAINNLSDASSSIMTLIGFRLARRPADMEHPYGHARFEYISGLGVAALILVIGVQMIKTSIGKIIHPEPVMFSGTLVTVLTLSIMLKLWMTIFNRRIGKRISSTTLIATATDSRNDVISTCAVLISSVISHLTGLELDGYIGLLVALFILYSGIVIGKETIRPLLGANADPELVKLIRDETLGFHPCILGIHDLMVHDYGPGQCFASLHAEIDKNDDVMVAHEVIDNIERMIWEKHGIQLVIHYDPIAMDDEELIAMRDVILQNLLPIDERLSAHDFRMVQGQEHSNIIFDLVIPYDMVGKKVDLIRTLNHVVQEVDQRYNVVITFDSHGFNQM
jgi:cation diffusion facilitator family transporter